MIKDLGIGINKVQILNENYCIRAKTRTWLDKKDWREIHDILRMQGFNWLGNGKDSCWIDDAYIRHAQDSKISANRTNVLNNGSTMPVIAGLAIGIAFVILFSNIFTFKPDIAKSDSELIEKTKTLTAVKYLISKYPDAHIVVNRSPSENLVYVQYFVDKELCNSNPDNFESSCITTLYIGVIMKQLHQPEVRAGCIGARSTFAIDDPIKYMESNDCFDIVGNDDSPKVSIDLPRYPPE